jgi:hypothetical protein
MCAAYIAGTEPQPIHVLSIWLGLVGHVSTFIATSKSGMAMTAQDHASSFLFDQGSLMASSPPWKGRGFL